jgi:uncharacterized damage-inducible protein DinB
MERRDVALRGDEQSMVRDYLDYHRATFLSKIAGLDKQQLAQSIPTSVMTLAGLTKHLALVEDSWFQETFLGNEDVEPWSSAPFDSDPDWDFHSAIDDDPADLVALYEAACARSRAAYADKSLDTESLSLDRRTGERFSLRWIMLHAIEETARHNGHADLLREAIDGATGE